MSWVSCHWCQYPFVSCVFDGVGRVVTLGHRFFSQNRLSVQTLLWCLCIPCVQSHASTSTDTLKSKALAGIQLFGCKIIQRRLGLPSNSEAKYGCPNGRELEAVTHTQFTYPLPPPPKWVCWTESNHTQFIYPLPLPPGMGVLLPWKESCRSWRT